MKLAVDWPMTDDEIETLRAAVKVKLDVQTGADELTALIRGLPQRHAVEFSLREAADFVLRQFATGATETQLITRVQPSASGDKLREDLP